MGGEPGDEATEFPADFILSHESQVYSLPDQDMRAFTTYEIPRFFCQKKSCVCSRFFISKILTHTGDPVLPTEVLITACGV